MTTPTIRAALERLVDLSKKHAIASVWDGAFFNARAALAAELAGEGPTDEELLESAAKSLGYKSIPSDETCLTAEAGELLDFARAVLARWARPAMAAPETPAEARAARPLLEQVARLGDDAGIGTVARIMAISSRVAAWLKENPPGQPVAIEPRGCPTPGACSCVELAAPPAPEAGEQLVRLACRLPEPAEVGELADRLGWIAAQLGDIGWSDDSASVARAAALLEQFSAPAPAVVPVADDRDPECVERWPECVPDGYDPRCCRFPKSCSCAHAIPLPQAGEGAV